MEEYSILYNKRFDESFMNALTESLKTWQIIFAIMRKKVMTQEYAIDVMLKNRVSILLEVEDNLINEMVNYLAKSQ